MGTTFDSSHLLRTGWTGALARMTCSTVVAACLAACFPLEGGDDGDSGGSGLGSGSGDDDDDTPPPNQACIVGLWTLSGSTGLGACVPSTPTPVEHHLVFEQRGDQVYGAVVDGFPDEQLAEAAFEDLGSNCRGVFIIRRTGAIPLSYTYDVTAINDVSVTGNVLLEMDGRCQQVWEVNGYVDKSY